MKITPDDTRHVAKLARLGLTDEEVASFAVQLNQILDHMDRLRELDTAGVPPTSYAVPLHNVTRPDDTWMGLPREEALAIAPDHAEGMYRVPTIVEEGDS